MATLWLLRRIRFANQCPEVFILHHSEIKSRSQATDFQIQKVKQWLKNANQAISEDEIAFLDQDDDLIPMVQKQKAPFRNFIDRHNLLKLPAWLLQKKVRPQTKPISSSIADSFRLQKNARLYRPEDFESQTTKYHKDAVLDTIGNCVIVMLCLVMVIGPTWLLNYISSDRSNPEARLGAVTGFVCLFTIMMSLVTVARQIEVLVTTAAYAVVLMIVM